MCPSESDKEPDQEYFLEIEAYFVERRGAPLLLSPEDWHMVRIWREKGLPLTVVKQGIDEVFDQRKAKAKPGRVNSLRYCRAAVERVWRQWRELNATATREKAESLDVRRALDTLARSLPPGLPGGEEMARRIRALEGPLEEVEDHLRALDSELLDSVVDSLEVRETEALDRELESSLERLAARTSPAQATRVREMLMKQLLRRRYGLPVLSLFSV